MWYKKLLHCTNVLYRYQNSSTKTTTNFARSIHNSFIKYDKKTTELDKEVALRYNFDDIKEKNRNTYLEMVKIFLNKDSVYRRGHVEFIYAALKNMKEFGVNKDPEVYKALIDILPKGKFIPTNIFQAEFMHYPKQQQCIIDLLEQMEDNAVMPDREMEQQLLNIFGKTGYPLRKYWRMMYWMPKFKNLSPWPVPHPVPDDIFELAKLAVARMSSVDVQSFITVYETADIKESIDKTWIVSAQAITQKQLLENHDIKQPLYVEGAFKIWIKDKPVNWFMLRSETKPPPDNPPDTDDVTKLKIPFLKYGPPVQKDLEVTPSVHEQEDGVIFSVCVTGTSSKDSLLSWIRHLEKENPNLSKIPIVFTLRQGDRNIAVVDGRDGASPNETSDEKIEDK